MRDTIDQKQPALGVARNAHQQPSTCGPRATNGDERYQRPRTAQAATMTPVRH